MEYNQPSEIVKDINFGNQANEKTIDQWKHLAEKKNWRITQLPNGFYQTECQNPDYEKKLDFLKGPKVVKTFK